MTEKAHGVEDVVVKQAEYFRVRNAEDVFVASHAAEEVDITNPQDVFFSGTDDQHKSVYRDEVFHEDDDVDVKGAEDVAVHSGGVEDTVDITNSEDVYVGQFEAVTAEDSNNVFIQSEAVDDNSIYLLDPGTVYLEAGSVSGEVFIHDADRVEVEDGAVSSSVDRVDKVDFPIGERSTVSIDNPDSVVVEEDAVSGDVITDSECETDGDEEAIRRQYVNGEITELEMEERLDEAMDE